ncbi:MAG: phthalyl amidase [Acidimicrobiales bacterium]
MATVAVGAVFGLGPSTAAGQSHPTCASPTTHGAAKGWKVADPGCEYDYITNAYTATFGPLATSSGKALSDTYVGTSDQAAYRIEVPKAWNGDLVLYSHPYRGLGNVVWVDSPALRSWFISHGFAWAASSFAANGYDIGQGVTDTHNLLAVFRARVHRAPKAVYLTGKSMGGQVAAVAAEHFKGAFAGVMTTCAPLADTQLYDYYLGVDTTAADLTQTPISFPAHSSIASVLQYEANVAARTLPGLGSGFLTPAGPASSDLTAAGKAWERAVGYLSGGSRWGFDSAFAYWNSTSYGPLEGMPTLFDVYPGLDGGTIGIAPGNVVTNIGVTYRVDGATPPTPADRALDAGVLRVRATTTSPAGSLSGIPVVQGDPGIPVLALFGTGDLFVPLSMGQDYAQRMAAHGESKLFVARSIREVTHCGFSNAELSQGFSSLVSWARSGRPAAGDDITSPVAVDSPTFGCGFTDGSHPRFHGPPCPK